MRFAIVVGVFLASCASRALACGYCVEDRMAAVYDHSVVVAATQRHHRVAFFAVLGDMTDAGAKGALQRAVQSVRGVDPGSARVSTEAGALSFAFDPGRMPLGELSRVLEQRLAARGCSAQLVTVLDKVTLPRRQASAPAAVKP